MKDPSVTQTIHSSTPEPTGTPSKPKKKRRFLRFLGWSLATLLVLVLVAGGLGIWTVMRSWPETDGTLEVAGLEQPVTVQRDESGVPAITAENTHDLFFSQGFVHAQDRFWEMDFRRHLTSGRLSELFGESQVGTDSFLRTLGWHEVAEQEVEALPAEVRAYYDAYAEGVNAYLAKRQGAELSLEYAVLGLQNSGYEPEPWTPVDSVAWLKAMAWDLRTNIEDETTRALIAPGIDPETLADLYPGYPFDEHPVIVDKDWAAEFADSDEGSGESDSTDLPADEPAAGDGGPSETDDGIVAPEVDDATGDGSVPGDESVPEEETAPGGEVSPALLTTGSSESVLAKVDAMIQKQGEGIGSNSWVISGELTDTGMPLLANDPHLGAELPSVWAQQQLRCSTVSEACPFDVAGFTFSGLPGIVIGHNDQIAWGFTNLTTDVADLYIERVDGDEYWQDGVKHPVTSRTETIKVAGGDDIEIEVRSTGHGPIISGLTPDFTQLAEDPRLGAGAGWREAAVEPGDDATALSGEFAVSLRWTALDPGSTAEAIFALNLAQNFTEFQDAASKFDVPAQNLIYADVEGNIGYQAPGRLPIRGAGDGWLPQPGWDSAYDWQGFIPFEQQPNLYNPASAFIVTANNAIVTDEYPYFLSRDWDYGYRAARITELIEQKRDEGPISADDIREIQMDNEMPAASSLKEAFAGLDVGDAGVQGALDLLAEWDGQNDADSAAAAYANVLWKQIVTLMTAGQGDIPLDDQSRFALVFAQQLEQPNSRWWQNSEAGVSSQEEMFEFAAGQAYDELVGLQGDDTQQWNWGGLHALTLTHGSFGTSGIAPIEWLFNRGPYSIGGGPGVVNATGWGLDDEGYATSTVPSMRMVIDVSDWDSSTWVNLTGASGHAFHKNYTDQTEDWASGVQRDWAFSTEAVNATTKDTLTLTPLP